MRKADLIIAGDLHLRIDQPTARKDNFVEALIEKLQFIRDLQEKNDDCPIIFPGDLFHKWKNPPELFNRLVPWLPKNIITTAGNHDLPYHNYEQLGKSSICLLDLIIDDFKLLHENDVYSTLHEFNPITFHGFPEGAELKKFTGAKNKKTYPQAAVVHHMVWTKNKPYPGCEAPNAKRFMKTLSGFDLIITGDNHEQFVVKNDKQILINAGSVMRMEADQMDHEPAVYCYFAENHKIIRIPLPFKPPKRALSRKHLEKKSQKDERMDAFVEKLTDQLDITLNFKKNLKRYIKKNKIKKSVEQKVWESMEDE